MQPTYACLVKRAELAATALATCLLIVKIFAWWYTGSVSHPGGCGRLADQSSGSALRVTPADADHTFRHGKAESLAALAQSMFISGSALFLFLTRIQHLASPNTLRAALVGVVW